MLKKAFLSHHRINRCCSAPPAELKRLPRWRHAKNLPVAITNPTWALTLPMKELQMSLYSPSPVAMECTNTPGAGAAAPEGGGGQRAGPVGMRGRGPASANELTMIEWADEG
jgi:hypothetical protein